METSVNETVVEAEVDKDKKKDSIDKRVVRLVTKPYLFPGETIPHSEEILIRAIGEKTYEKSYVGLNPGTTEVRRVKRVTLNKETSIDGTKISNVTEYFNYLLSNRGYSLVTE